MGGNMTGTIRGRMGDFMGEQIGGNFRGQTRMEADVGRMRRTADMGVEPRESFGGTFRSGGGDLSYSDRNLAPRYSAMMMEQEDFRPTMRGSTSGDRDLRSAARDQFQSNFVIGGGSSKTVQSDSFSVGSRERPSFVAGRGAGGARRGGGPGHTTWSN